MTEKLYYNDAYIEEFCATVLSCETAEDLFDVVLDKTAFFPEEGGQYSDRGTLGTANVIDVKEKCGVIHHYIDSPIEIGEIVNGKIDFCERYEKMQCHTGEHIISGLIHKYYGLENVGFHLGKEDVTMDISAPLTRDDLDNIERLANEVIYKNIEVTTIFPTSSELSEMNYRSKLELKEGVRIVNIGEYDSCACCAPHVKHTGEIGLIKILDFSKLRGGIRIYIAAGRRAMRIFKEFYNNAQNISARLSVPKNEISDGVCKLFDELMSIKSEYSEYRLRMIKSEAEKLDKTDGNVLRCYPDASMDELIEFSNASLYKIGGTLILLSGTDGNYKYVIASNSVDLRTAIADINKSLLGRGGGKPNMIQGSFASSLDEIKSYFTL